MTDKKDTALKLARDWINANGSYDRAAAILTVIDLALADSALERMAENARELGLDYEPAQQQEPVAWRYKKEGGGWFVSDNEPQYVEQWNDIEEIQPLYTSPPARKPWVGDRWQPIETAQKHGEICVAKEFAAGRWAFNHAWWNPETEEWQDEFGDFVLAPTHWMPLPAAHAKGGRMKKPAQQTCNCRWEGETQVQQCTLHEAHVDAIHEWAERAKAAEAKLKAQPLTDEEIWDEVKAADLDWQTGWSLDEDAANRYITFARAIEAAHGIKGDA